MPSTLIRVSVRVVSDDSDDTASATDLALPSAMSVGELLPSITRACGADGDAATPWQLRHLTGSPLYESETLRHNDVRDGDVMLLVAEDRPGTRVVAETVTSVLARRTEPPAHDRTLRPLGCIWLLLLGVLVTGWTGLGAHGLARYGTAVSTALVLIGAAVFTARMRGPAAAATTLDTAVVGQLAVAGFLVVPSGPGAANYFLAAVAAASSALVFARLSHTGTTVLTAIGAGSTLVALVTACGVIWPLDARAIGAMLGTLGVGGLSIAPRIAIAAAGLAPPQTDADDDIAEDNSRVAQGHQILTGLVYGCCVTAVAGALLLVACAGSTRIPAVPALAAAIAVAMLLRARSYVSCRAPLIVAGLAHATAVTVVAVLWWPPHGMWIGSLVVIAGLALLVPRRAVGPVATRVVDTFEYLALVAVLPLTCWLTGIFDAIGTR